MAAWDDYQEDVASLFRTLGLEAATNVTVRGVRTSHDIDVVVKSDHVGFNMLWVVECKHWGKPVSKLHVLALREIVSDIGADRGLLMAENGFQSGARDAAELTNVRLTSVAEVRDSAAYTLGIASLRSLQERVDKCKERYWNLSKDVRIEYGLRHDVGIPGFSARVMLDTANAALGCAFRGIFPPVYDGHHGLYDEIGVAAESPVELFEVLNPLIAQLENHLDDVYRAIAEQQ